MLCSACHPLPQQTTYQINECGKQYKWQVIQGKENAIYASQFAGDQVLVMAFGTHGNQDSQPYIGVQFNLRTAPDLPYQQPEKLKGRYILVSALPQNSHAQNQGIGILWRGGQPGQVSKDGELAIDEIKIIEQIDQSTFGTMTGRFHFKIESTNKSECIVSGEFHEAGFNM